MTLPLEKSVNVVAGTTGKPLEVAFDALATKFPDGMPTAEEVLEGLTPEMVAEALKAKPEVVALTSESTAADIVAALQA